MKIVTLLENTACREGLRADHGLSLYIETPRHKILFDMGPNSDFLANAQALGVDLAAVDTAVLSHGHYDHGDGLPAFARHARAEVLIHMDAFGDFYAVEEGKEPRYIGLDPDLWQIESRVLPTGGLLRLDEELTLFADEGDDFPALAASSKIHVQTGEGFQPDDFHHEQNLLIQAGGKAVLIAGCAHRGIVNILAGAYDLQGNYGKTGNYEDEYGILINKLPYPDLRWEKTTSVDVAVEASFWNRLRVSVGAYNKLTSDLLAEVPFPSSAGVGNQYTNNGSVRNRGLEFEIDATVFQNDDWKVRFGGNATYMRSKIIQLPDNGNLNNRQGGQQVYNAAGDLIWVGGKQEGQEYGVAYAYRMIDIVRSEADLQNFAWYVDTTPSSGTIYGPGVWATLTADEQAKGQLLQPGDAIFYDVNGDNTIDQYDQVKMGNTVPRWVGGVNLSVDWKGLSLYARFDFATGYVAQNSRKQYYMALSQGTFNTLKESKDTWSEERPNAKYPILMYADTKFRNNYRMSNIFYDDSSYLCAREIALSYSLPERWARVVRMKNLTVSVTGQNLFYWTGSSLYNPEYGVNGNGGYAIPRTVLFGIKATF